MNFHRGVWTLSVLLGWLGANHAVAQTSTQPGGELRALHVDASQPGIRSVAEVTQLVQTTRAAHFNALWIEIRKNGETYWRSNVEPHAPWSDDSYDPLSEVLRQAHDTNSGPRLEVHGWIDLLPVWDQRTVTPPSALHVFRQHPEWVTRHQNGTNFGRAYLLDPGHPGVSDYLATVVTELAAKYELDGLVLGGLQYPDDEISGSRKGWGFNPVALQRFQHLQHRATIPDPADPLWDQFRRDQLTTLARRLAFEAMTVRPGLKLAAVGIAYPNGDYPISWENTSTYREIFQDWRGWVREGWLDTVVPLLDFDARRNRRDWEGWSTFVKENRSGRQVILGLKTSNNNLNATLSLAHSVRRSSEHALGADGLVLRSYSTPTTDHSPGELFASLVKPSSSETNLVPLFQESVTVPNMPWKTRPTRARLWVRCPDGTDGLDAARVDLRGAMTRTLTADANGWIGSADLLPGEYLLSVRPFGTQKIRAVGTFTARAGMTAQPHLWPADEDADRDGMSNLDELTVGTDPLNPESKLAVDVTVLADRLQLQVRPVRPGRQYHLEAADHSIGPWQSVSDTASLDGSEASVELPGATRHFRVRVEY